MVLASPGCPKGRYGSGKSMWAVRWQPRSQWWKRPADWTPWAPCCSQSSRPPGILGGVNLPSASTEAEPARSGWSGSGSPEHDRARTRLYGQPRAMGFCPKQGNRADWASFGCSMGFCRRRGGQLPRSPRSAPSRLGGWTAGPGEAQGLGIFRSGLDGSSRTVGAVRGEGGARFSSRSPRVSGRHDRGSHGDR